MKIVIDNKIFLRQKFGGVSRYFVELQSRLNTNEKIESRIIAPIHINSHLHQSHNNQKHRLFMPKSTNRFKFDLSIKLLSDYLSVQEMKEFNPNLIHETFYTLTDPWNKKIKRVTTVYDLIREKIDPVVSKSEAKKATLGRSEKIICISNNTKNDLIEFYNLPEDKCEVVYLGVDSIFSQVNPLEKVFWDRPYILYVGQRTGYKNFEFFIKALSRVSNFGKEFGLICFGGGKFTDSEKALFSELSLSFDDIRHESGSDEILKVAYSQAMALVYPSLYEGFGLPIVEAMASKCIVITSDSISLAEAGGGVAINYQSRNLESLTDAIENALALDPESKSMKLDAGLSWASKFDWNATALNTQKIYLEI